MLIVIQALSPFNREVFSRWCAVQLLDQPLLVLGPQLHAEPGAVAGGVIVLTGHQASNT